MLTLFRTLEELSALHSARLVYMTGAAEHRKDALEFLLHDMKHMEHFVDPITHREQVSSKYAWSNDLCITEWASGGLLPSHAVTGTRRGPRRR